MALSVEVNVLKQMQLFADVDESKLKLIAFAGYRIVSEPKEVLCRQDEESDSVYIVLDGEVDVFRETNTGRVPLARLGPGRIIGEIGVLCNRERTATVVAATKLTVLRIEKDVFVEFVTELPQLARAIIQELSERLLNMNRALAAATTNSHHGTPAQPAPG